MISFTNASAIVRISSRMLTMPSSNLGISDKSGPIAAKVFIAVIAFL